VANGLLKDFDFFIGFLVFQSFSHSLSLSWMARFKVSFDQLLSSALA